MTIKRSLNLNKSIKIVNKNPVVDYLKINETALEQVKSLLNNRAESCEGIRVGVRTRGCSGLSYVVEYAVLGKNISKFDDVVIADGVSVFIDPQTHRFLSLE